MASDQTPIEKAPKPYGDGKSFDELPGGHVPVEGPGGVYVFCSDERQAAEVWKELSKAYAHAHVEAQRPPMSYAMSKDYEALYDHLCNGGEALAGELKVGNTALNGDFVMDIANSAAYYRTLWAITDSGFVSRISSATQPHRLTGTQGNRMVVQPSGSTILGRPASSPYLRFPGHKAVSYSITTNRTLAPNSTDDISDVGFNADVAPDYNPDFNSIYWGMEHHYIDSGIQQKYDEIYLQWRRSPTMGGQLPPLGTAGVAVPTPRRIAALSR